MLDDGDVRAELFINGNLFFDAANNTAQYVVPAASGVSAVYAASLWVGGTVNDTIRVASALYERFAFRPGPLNPDGTVPNPTDCSAYDRIFVVSADDLAAYEATGTATPDLADWPATWGAEVLDGDGIPGNYNLAGGDRPRLYGTQTAFWVMNDPATPNPFVPSPPIGLEVQVTAAAFESADPVFAQAALYRFRLVKRTPGTMADARVGLFIDPDLGHSGDDYLGTDVPRGMAFVYNSDNLDEMIGGIPGYGANPPALGYDWLTGAGSHMYQTGAGPVTDEAATTQEVLHRLNGRWNDGRPQTEGGDGTGTGGTVTPWSFPGDAVTGAFWSARNLDGNGAQATPSDQRSIFATATLTLTPGVPVDVVLALPFARGANHLDSITRLRAASDAIQAAYDANTLFPVAGEMTAPAASALALSPLRPNPAAGSAETTVTLPTASTARVAVVDVLGREVAVVYAGVLAAGPTVLRLPGALAPGVYAVVAESAGDRAVTRLTIAR